MIIFVDLQPLLMKRFWFIMFFLLPVLQEVKGQYMTSPKMKNIWPQGRSFKLSSWHLAGGGIYNIGTTGGNTVNLIDTKNTTYSAEFDPKGKFGYYVEAGRYHITDDLMFFKYLDYSLAWKRLAGSETYTGTYTVRTDSSTASATTGGQGNFKDNIITLNLNLNNVIQVMDYGFIQNTIGINADYRLNKATPAYEAGDPYNAISATAPEQFFTQLHYRLGFGYKLKRKLFIIPAFETPILSVFPWDNFNSTLSYFNSRYRPIMFSVRLLFVSSYRKSAY